jgi:hypothetical protein
MQLIALVHNTYMFYVKKLSPNSAEHGEVADTQFISTNFFPLILLPVIILTLAPRLSALQKCL